MLLASAGILSLSSRTALFRVLVVKLKSNKTAHLHDCRSIFGYAQGTKLIFKLNNRRTFFWLKFWCFSNCMSRPKLQCL